MVKTGALKIHTAFLIERFLRHVFSPADGLCVDEDPRHALHKRAHTQRFRRRVRDGEHAVVGYEDGTAIAKRVHACLRQRLGTREPVLSDPALASDLHDHVVHDRRKWPTGDSERCGVYGMRVHHGVHVRSRPVDGQMQQ